MEKRGFYDLVEIMKVLRKQCMWDKEQTHQSIRRNFIEETYEAIEAIDNGDLALLKEELGDVLLQVVFHTEIETEQGSFDIDDVCEGICAKLVLRHPHIFGDVEVSSADDVLNNWDKIKKVEKNQKNLYEVLASVSKSLPSLIRADKIYSKLLKDESFVDQPVEISLDTLENSNDLEHDLSKMMFDLIKIAKHNDIDLEHGLAKYCDFVIETFK